MKMIKIELKKAFTGNRFWLAFGIGQFLGISSIFNGVPFLVKPERLYTILGKSFPVRQAYTLYNVWMLNEQMSIDEFSFSSGIPFSGGFSFAAS